MNLFEEWLNMNELQHESHQADAVKWCLQKETDSGVKGGIIADEMGLGKTIEILGTVYSNNLPNTLIVLPYSLIGQWEKIILKLFGISPLIFHGSNRKRLTETQIKFHPIVLTTYGLISDIKNKKPMNVYDYENILYNIKWDRVIYDEAHHLRNKATKVNIGARKVKSDIIWLMTGTPIQNSEKDLYTLFGLLGIKANKDNVETLIQEYMLRRTKEKAGIKLQNIGDYRSYEQQLAMFKDRYSTTDGGRKPQVTRTWDGKTWYLKPKMSPSSSPGRSNHGLGLAIDINVTKAEVLNWLCENAPKYGFYLQSDNPASPEFENWHWQYVCGDETPEAVKTRYEANQAKKAAKGK